MRTATPARVLLAVAAAAGALGAAAEPGSAQDDLRTAATAFARAWGSEDVDALARVMEEEGVRLKLDADSHARLEVRQAAAAVRDFLGGRLPAPAAVARVETLGGDPVRGYAELRWETRVTGTSEPIRYTVFVGFTRTARGWRVDELRVLP